MDIPHLEATHHIDTSSNEVYITNPAYPPAVRNHVSPKRKILYSDTRRYPEFFMHELHTQLVGLTDKLSRLRDYL